jgi:3,4-dihydroxy 2-butanone 4-phosphate synthase/GTP cyclohydrolase II
MEPIERALARVRANLQAGNRPCVTLTYAQSLDGSISARRGQPLPLSGPASARLTHQLRSSHDAILVGIGTVLSDDPRLDVRLVEGRNPQPVVLDSQLRTPPSSNLLGGVYSPARVPLIVATEGAPGTRVAALQASGAEVLCLPADEDGLVSLPHLLPLLRARGIERLMVEGGARVIASFLRQRLVDFFILTIAPVLVGGLRAIEEGQWRDSAPTGRSFPRIQEGDWARLGEDLVYWGRPAWLEDTPLKPG